MNDNIITSRMYAFYIPKEFIEVWNNFLDLVVPKYEDKYKDRINKLKEENKDKKGVANKNYQHKKASFVSEAIRDLIRGKVNFEKSKLLKEDKKPINSNIV